MSKDQQVKEVVEAVALAVLQLGVRAVTSNKMSLEFAFNHAWRRWGCTRLFPSIKGHDPGNQFWIGVGRSERRRGAFAAWETGAWAQPYVKIASWTAEEALRAHASEEISYEDWMELGRLFVEYFKPEEVDYV